MDDLYSIAARLENTIGDLYEAFAEALPEERVFWLRIAEDERTHAHWVESFADFVDTEQANPGIARPRLESLARSLQHVCQCREQAASGDIDMTWALRTAWDIEHGYLEANYARMISATDGRVRELLEQLLEGQRQHAGLLREKAAALQVDIEKDRRR